MAAALTGKAKPGVSSARLRCVVIRVTTYNLIETRFVPVSVHRFWRPRLRFTFRFQPPFSAPPPPARPLSASRRLLLRFCIKRLHVDRYPHLTHIHSVSRGANQSAALPIQGVYRRALGGEAAGLFRRNRRREPADLPSGG